MQTLFGYGPINVYLATVNKYSQKRDTGTFRCRERVRESSDDFDPFSLHILYNLDSYQMSK